MSDSGAIDLRLERYFFDSFNDIGQDDIKKDWREFYDMSFCTRRNRDTHDLIAHLSPHLKGRLESISDNVMIFPSLKDSVENLVAQGFVVADRIAFDFLEYTYGVSLEPSEINYIDDICDGKDLENIISAYETSSNHIIIAVGGGRTMDYAKYISWVTGAKLLAIPSSLATHVYASPKIHALDPIKDLGFSKTIDGNPAHLTLIDVNLLSSLFANKKRLVFSGFGDIMAFINSQNDWKDSAKDGKERYSLFADKSIDLVIKTLVEIDVSAPLATWISDYIFIQCLLCHITDWVGSAPASGAEHLFAKTIEDEISEQPLHGEVVALGVLIFAYIRGQDVGLTVSLMRKFQISNELKQLGLTKNALVKALTRCGNEGLKKKRYTILQDLDDSPDFFRGVIAGMINENLLMDSS